ncbi:MAG TPA: DUF5683 domain-containing protein [Cyclobacteriaceae bacterium]|nr:hypothetical protein [Cyclobacteriaceae bacterium]HMV09643.1 DUF5683 domain-containing protein [Cyclobacteriaceae bacterium]HMV89538.1 DUF5683 domain-containing protein [Cyclobacteriaceae bacterium]HMX01025.1 DUF5683 domain-containing protein [Cyclobacteriaceae bacterium]HMX52021.1 DUF5683 domain-containing protein [Cyclobacteriaceae bacterium]
MKKILLACLITGFSMTAYGQDSLRSKLDSDTVFLKSDTATIASYASRYDPRKAILFAAILPGLGQIYNKKYWKLPLVYGGFVGFGYGVNFYQSGYKEFKGALFDLLESGESTIKVRNITFNEQSLRTVVDRYRRQRDFFIILSAGMYLLQMIDAHVDAHLKEFDLNPNLHVKIQPTMNSDMLTGRTTGISLIVKF